MKRLTSPRINGGRRKGLPHDGLADVGGDEERNARSQSVSLLQQLVKEQDDETRDEELDDDEQANAGADV